MTIAVQRFEPKAARFGLAQTTARGFDTLVFAILFVCCLPVPVKRIGPDALDVYPWILFGSGVHVVEVMMGERAVNLRKLHAAAMKRLGPDQADLCAALGLPDAQLLHGDFGKIVPRPNAGAGRLFRPLYSGH